LAEDLPAEEAAYNLAGPVWKSRSVRLALCDGNVSAAAREAGVDRKEFHASSGVARKDVKLEN